MALAAIGRPRDCPPVITPPDQKSPFKPTPRLTCYGQIAELSRTCSTSRAGRSGSERPQPKEHRLSKGVGRIAERWNVFSGNTARKNRKECRKGRTGQDDTAAAGWSKGVC